MTTITALPEAPNRGTDDPANFSSKADTFVAALQTFQIEANLVATETNAAAGSAVAAAAAATSVTGVAKWAGTTTSYTNGAAVWSPANYKTYRLSIASKAANGANTDPSVDTASWTLVNGTGDVITTSTQTLTNKTLTNPVINGFTGSTAVVNIGAGQFYKDAAGNLGIGATALSGALHIAKCVGGVNGNDIYIARSAAGTATVGQNSWIQLWNTTDGKGSGFQTFDGGTIFWGYSGGWVERMRIDAAGNLQIGTSSGARYQNQRCLVSTISANGDLAINHSTANASGDLYAGFGYNGAAIGSITQSGTTAVLYNTTSDQRLKTNIVDAPAASVLIDSIQVRSFDWISDGSHQRYGMVAQELFDVAPEAVHTPADPTEMMAVDYSKLVPMLIKEVQSLRARVAALEA